MHLENYLKTLGCDAPPPRLGFERCQDGDVLRWQAKLRAALESALGLERIAARRLDRPLATLRQQVRETDHVREEWEVQTERDYAVPLYLLRPLGRGDGSPRPLVITPHGHSRRGREIYAGLADSDADLALIREGERDIALQAVCEGYIVIAHEARAFGQSRGPAASAEDKPYVCEEWQKRALLRGRTLIGERVWDVMRLLDWAATLEDVDGARIAITGNSGGGTVSLFAAAIDPRIRVCVPGSYFCTFIDSIGSIRHCGCNYIPGLLELAEMSDVAGLIAPRAFLAVHGQGDPIFPIEATRVAFARLQRLYQAVNAAERCRLFVGEGGHRYYKAPVWPFVKQWL